MDDLQQMRLTSSSCAKVFIQRDYSEGVGVKFETKLPSELQGKIEREEFEEVVSRLNAIYAEAEGLTMRTFLKLPCLFNSLSSFLVLANIL